MTQSSVRHSRIVGLDVARALALLGMFAAHIGNTGERVPDGWPALVVTHGRSSALFALLAGVSIALMLSRSAAAEPVRHTRIRVLVRGAMLLVLGWFLSALGTPVDVILDNLGVMFALACLALTWRPWVLLGVGAGILTVGGALLKPLVAAMPPWLYDLPLVHELWSEHYPALLWIGYVLVGMGLGKLRPWRGGALGWLTASGLVLAVVAYGTGTWLEALNGERDWYAVGAHSYTAFETLGNVGVACMVIGVCCWLAPRLPRLLWPLAATGAMTLTLYSAQILVLAIVGPQIVFQPSNVAWLVLCGASIVFASLWRWRLGQGPLERLFTAASTAAADADARSRVSHPA